MKHPSPLARLVPPMLCLLSPAYAGTWGWLGNVDADWNNPLNWANVTIDPLVSAPVPGTDYALDFLRVSNWAVVGTDEFGAPITQVYPGAVYNPGAGVTTSFGSGRGLVIGVGNGPASVPANVKGSASLTISSGTIVVNRPTAGTGSEPFMANRADATLLINGGSLEATNINSALQFRLIQEGFPGITSTITISSGSMSTTFLNLLYDAENDPATVFGSGIINLDGTGVLTVNRILRSHGGNPGQTSSTINFNGGTLRSRAANTSFLLDLADTNVFVKAGGAKIETPTGFGVTIAEPLLHDPALGASLDGGLTKTGAAGLTLSATTSTYNGGTTINEGSLIIASNGALGDPTGGITFSGNSNLNVTASITDSARPITVNPGILGRIQMAAGTSFTTTGKLSGSGTFEVRDTGTGTARSVTLASQNNDFTGRIGFTYATNSQQTSLTVNSLVDAPGAGNIFFNGFNNIFPSFNLGADAAAGLTLNHRRIELAGTMGTSGFAGISNLSAVHPMVINTDLLVTGTAGARRLLLAGAAGPVNVFDGDIADGVDSPVTVSKGGNASTWTLSGNNSFTGGLTLSGLSVGSQLNLNSPTAMGLGTFTITGGSNGVIDNTSGGPIVLTTNNPHSWNNNFRFLGSSSLHLGSGAVTMGGSREVTVSGSTLTVGGPIGATVATSGLRKMGNAVMVLEGANTYQGPTTVSFGRLVVNGSIHADSVVTVDNFGTLSGNGTVGGSVTVIDSGKIAPGASAGVLTIGGGLDISALATNAGSLLQFELDALAATNDRINVGGALVIGTGAFGLNDFTFTNLGGLQVGTYTLLSAGSISGELDGADVSGTLGDFNLLLQKNDSTIDLVVSSAAPPAPTFGSWLSGFSLGSLTGFEDDADADGKANGLEYFLGTNPSAASDGIVLVSYVGNTMTFTHPQNTNLGADVTATYRWTKNLTTVLDSGATDGEGTTVTFTAQPNTPAAGTTTVTATVSGTPVTRLFVSIRVTQ